MPLTTTRSFDKAARGNFQQCCSLRKKYLAENENLKRDLTCIIPVEFDAEGTWIAAVVIVATASSTLSYIEERREGC